MNPSEEILKFKTGEKVIWAENFFDRRAMLSKHIKDIHEVIESNCIEVKESFYIKDGYYNLRISGIKK